MTDRPVYRVPCATYRVQFQAGFRFVDGRDLAPYLHDLGITDLYSSPPYKARRGSAHGYDVANPMRINSELGAEEDFDEMAARLRHYDMGVLLDIVPNHMAASPENPWWLDVLENGPASAYASYFDIDWRPAAGKAAYRLAGKVLLPIMGDLYGEALHRGELSLRLDDGGFFVRYFDTRLPLDPRTYAVPVSLALRREGDLEALRTLLPEIERLPARDEPDPERVLERRRDKELVKEKLWRACHSQPDVKRALDDALREINGVPGDAASFDSLDRLLEEQAYRVACWKIGYEEINYRRFFDVNELVGLRVEIPEVFDNRHRRSLELAASGRVTGFRIDHVDGLWDPACYLRRLQAAAASGGRFYVVVEKILGRHESLPGDWAASGATGYEFLNAVNAIQIEPGGLALLEEGHARRTGNRLSFAELRRQCALQVMEQLFLGEVNDLSRRLGQLAARHRMARDVRLTELTRALVETTACLPVYRTYIHTFEISEADRRTIAETLALARTRTPEDEASPAAFDFLRAVLLLDPPHDLVSEKSEWLRFVMRWQQFTGPVMAKGLEDTAAYRRNSLLSLNEVGGDSLRDRDPLTLEEFHEFNRRRAEEWPDTLNCTATHDTKRGEDVRARLNVLTEAAGEWERLLDRWSARHEPVKPLVQGRRAPDASEEALLYQTLLGALPHREEDLPGFPARVKEFLTKALREAKLNSSWIRPNLEYEAAVESFFDALWEDVLFRADLREFHLRIAPAGAINGLSQLLLKIAAPGVPDFYQGTEFWQYALVDPDNRRPVDYKVRTEALERLRADEAADPIALIRRLASDPQRDEVKLWTAARALEFRRAHRDLFARGAYRPLAVRGERARHVCAFLREHEGERAAAVTPRWTTLIGEWGDAELELPEGEWRDALTGLHPASARLADVLREFPVALLAAC